MLYFGTGTLKSRAGRWEKGGGSHSPRVRCCLVWLIVSSSAEGLAIANARGETQHFAFRAEVMLSDKFGKKRAPRGGSALSR